MTRMSQAEHKAQGPQSIRCFVITVSDSRTEETDRSGAAIIDLLNSFGHIVAGRTIVRDEPVLVRDTVERQLANPDVQVVITTGRPRWLSTSVSPWPGKCLIVAIIPASRAPST